MKKVVFYESAFDEYNEWAKENPKIHSRIREIIKMILRDPFHGIGKPEPLKYELTDCWSRRITSKHRLVYMVTNNEIIVVTCKYHY